MPWNGRVQIFFLPIIHFRYTFHIKLRDTSLQIHTHVKQNFLEIIFTFQNMMYSNLYAILSHCKKTPITTPKEEITTSSGDRTHNIIQKGRTEYKRKIPK